jgi:hypothetical protein
MRIWHFIFGIVVLALILVICRDTAGQVAVVVFFTAIGELVFGTAALLALFQTLGALGHAKGLVAVAEASIATVIVLAVATTLMSGCLFAGAWLVRAATY